MALLEGAGAVLVTPLRENGEVNYEKLKEIVEEQIARGTDAIIACGVTGEASTMTHEERLDVIEYVCRVTKKRIPVVAGTGSNCTETVVYLSAEAERRGANGLLLVPLYYNKAIQRGPMVHFTAVADAVEIPVILYNVPDRTGVTVKPETIAILRRDVDNIVGVKGVSSNSSAIVTLISLSGGRVDLYSGSDDQTMPLLSLGGKGIIFVLSDAVPRQTRDTRASRFAGDVKTSATFQLKVTPLITELSSEVGPIPVKAAMNMMSKRVGPLRIPLTETEPQNQEKLKKAMTAYGILQGGLRERTVYQW